MEDKKQDVKLLEELLKAADEFRKWAVDFGNKLSKVLPDVEIPEEEEDTWEMKCPYKVGDEYYYVYRDGCVRIESWENLSMEISRWHSGNIFPTKKAAELEAKRRNLLTRFRAFRNECNGDWKPDWSEQDSKYFLCYSQKFDILSTNDIHICERFHTFGYFKTESDARKSIKLFGDEIIELFVKSEGGEKMKTINEIKDDELVFNEQTHSQIEAYDLKRDWNSFNEDERSGWRTLKEREKAKISAESVLDWIYDSMDSEGYEDMFVYLWDDTSEEFKQRLQKILDEISDFPSAMILDVDETINPYVDLEEE